MLYKGDKKLSFWQGDRKPYALFKGEKQITGAVKKMLSGESIQFSSPYKAPFPSVEVDGMGFQGFKTGKNLIPFPYYEYRESFTGNGVTYTTDKNGVVTMEGNATGFSQYLFQRRMAIKQGEKYVYSIHSNEPIKNIAMVAALYEEEDGEVIKSFTFRVGEALPQIAIDLTQYPLVKFINIQIKPSSQSNTPTYFRGTPQLELGTAATPYEPYWAIGDKPVLSGKNLWDNFTIYGKPYKEINPPLRVNKGDIIRFSYDKLNGTKYRLMMFGSNIDGTPFDGLGTSSQGIHIYLDAWYTATEDRIQLGSDNNTPMELKVNKSFLIKGIQYWETTESEPFVNPILTINNPTVPYEPYCGGSPTPNPYYPIEPVFNANSKLEVEGINLIKRTTDISNNVTSMYLYTDLKVKRGETFTLYCNQTIMDGVYFGKMVDGRYKGLVQKFNANTITYTAEEDMVLAGLIYHTFGIPKDVKVAIVRGDKPLWKYEPYTPPQTVDVPILRAIPNTEYKDTYNPQTQIITRRVGEIVLTGEENFVHFTPDAYCYWMLLKDAKFIDSNIPMVVSNMYIGKASGGGLKEFDKYEVWLHSWDKYKRCHFSYPSLEVTDFKNHLKQKYTEGNPIKVWYVLAEPQEEKVSVAPLVQDWSGEIKATWGDCGIPEVRAEVWEEGV